MNPLLTWLDDNCLLIAAVVGIVIGLGCLLVILNALIGCMFTISKWWNGKRLVSLKRASDCQVIRLQMKRRAKDDDRQGEELQKLTANLAAERTRVGELTKMNQVQDDLLSTRAILLARKDEEIADLKQGMEEVEDSNRALHESLEDAEKSTREYESKLAEAQEEISNQQQIISMLEGQLSTQKKSADMSNAGMEDLRRELDQLRTKFQAAQEANELLRRCMPATVPA